MELTDSLKALFIETAKALQGSARRLFMARTVKELGAGGQRRAERELGWGRMTGTARLVIEDLTITQNHLDSLDAEIVVQPAGSEANFIERDLLSEVLQRTIGVPLPTFLPERFEYARLGVRFEVRDELLHVFGTHGPRGKTILSVRLGEQEVGVVFEPEEPFELSGHMDKLRSRLLANLEQQLQTLTPEDAWRAISSPPQRGPGPGSRPRREPGPE